MSENTLSSCMGFRLPDGSTFLISKEDIEHIRQQVIVKIVTDHGERVFMPKDTGIERARLLYTVYCKEKESMTDQQRVECLAKIIQFLSEANYSFETLKELIEKQQTK